MTDNHTKNPKQAHSYMADYNHEKGLHMQSLL